MAQVSQQNIEYWLWESANFLRSPVNLVNLRDFVLPEIPRKRLSDTLDEERQKAIAKFETWRFPVLGN